VITESRYCNLYVDVEWTKKGGLNAWIDGESVMQTLVQRLLRFFSTVFDGVQCSPEQVLHLDSSTPEKFSRHLIFNATCSAQQDDDLPLRALFADNIHAGAFMADFVENEAASAGLSTGQHMDWHTLHQQHNENEATRLFCFDSDSRLCLCVDMGIYNRNRCFRLPLSSKCGKAAVLLPHDSNQMPLDGSDACLLKSSLVCPVEDSLKQKPIRLLTHLRALKSEMDRSAAACTSRTLSLQNNSNYSVPQKASFLRSNGNAPIDDAILRDWANRTGLSGQCSGIKASC
jgi:hypothetical protein